MRFPPRRCELPTQAVIQGQVRTVAPTVLSVHSEIAPARVHGDLASLLVASRSPNEEVGEVDSRLRAIKSESTVPGSELIIRDLVVMEIEAELDRMRSNHF